MLDDLEARFGGIKPQRTASSPRPAMMRANTGSGPMVPLAARDTLRYAWHLIADRCIVSAAGTDFSGWVAEETDRLQYGWASTVSTSRSGDRRFRPGMRYGESSDIAAAASRLHFADY